MKIVSFDVGIKNLAYCVIEKLDTQNNDFKILEWGIINLAENQKQCGFINKKNKKCNSNACFVHNNNYFCKAHNKVFSKNHDFALTPMDTVMEMVAKEEKCACIDVQCKKKASFVFEEKSYCEKHGKLVVKNKKLELCTKKIPKQNANRTGINILAKSIFNKLDSLTALLTVNEVLIENQPGLINPTMKTISSFLFSYFYIRGIIDKKSIQSVNFFSPSNKLKVNKKQTDVVLKKEKEKENKAKDNGKEIYTLTKNLGIAYCTAILKGCNSDKIEILNKAEKKDDLCDAFLQGFFYLFCKEEVPMKYQKILETIKEPVKPIKSIKPIKKLKGVTVKDLHII